MKNINQTGEEAQKANALIQIVYEDPFLKSIKSIIINKKLLVKSKLYIPNQDTKTQTISEISIKSNGYEQNREENSEEFFLNKKRKPYLTQINNKKTKIFQTFHCSSPFNTPKNKNKNKNLIINQIEKLKHFKEEREEYSAIKINTTERKREKEKYTNNSDSFICQIKRMKDEEKENALKYELDEYSKVFSFPSINSRSFLDDTDDEELIFKRNKSL